MRERERVYVIPAIVATLVIGVIVGVIIGSVLTVRYGEVHERRDGEVRRLEQKLERYEAAMPRLRQLDEMERFDAALREDQRERL